MEKKLTLTELKEIARDSGAFFYWEIGKRFEGNDEQVTCSTVGPEWDREEWDDEDLNSGPPQFDENTLVEVWGNEYDDKKIARFIATFDPPTVLDLIEKASLRDEALYEEIGKIGDEIIYKRRSKQEVDKKEYSSGFEDLHKA